MTYQEENYIEQEKIGKNLPEEGGEYTWREENMMKYDMLDKKGILHKEKRKTNLLKQAKKYIWQGKEKNKSARMK